MDLIIHSLKSIAVAIIEPMHLVMLVVFGIIFYFKNVRIVSIQKMTLGEGINSPLELTLSQIVLGILAGAIGSIILSVLGVTFSENSGIESIALSTSDNRYSNSMALICQLYFFIFLRFFHSFFISA